MAEIRPMRGELENDGNPVPKCAAVELLPIPVLELIHNCSRKPLNLNQKFSAIPCLACGAAAQRRGSDCVFFAQHLPEIGQTEL